jgi:hypothetical protein
VFYWLVTAMAGAWPTSSMIFQIASELWDISNFFPPRGKHIVLIQRLFRLADKHQIAINQKQIVLFGA